MGLHVSTLSYAREKGARVPFLLKLNRHALTAVGVSVWGVTSRGSDVGGLWGVGASPFSHRRVMGPSLPAVIHYYAVLWSGK